MINEINIYHTDRYTITVDNEKLPVITLYDKYTDETIETTDRDKIRDIVNQNAEERLSSLIETYLINGKFSDLKQVYIYNIGLAVVEQAEIGKLIEEINKGSGKMNNNIQVFNNNELG